MKNHRPSQPRLRTLPLVMSKDTWELDDNDRIELEDEEEVRVRTREPRSDDASRSNA